MLRLSYNEVVSQTKIVILRAIDGAGEEVESFERLSEVSGFGKPLLRYHTRGEEGSRGLVELGLVQLERGK